MKINKCKIISYDSLCVELVEYMFKALKWWVLNILFILNCKYLYILSKNIQIKEIINKKIRDADAKSHAGGDDKLKFFF